MLQSVELFAGAGGLGMGTALAGFTPLAVVDWDRWACDTLRENGNRGYPLVKDWPVWEGDVSQFDWASIPDNVDLVAGGPPCQPFSMGGKHKAFGDKRDMFPATVDVIRTLNPKSFLIENVKGLLRSSFSEYFEYIRLQLTFPELVRKEGEDWRGHLARLQAEKRIGIPNRSFVTYNVMSNLLNAADHGVPQQRERAFIVGFRSDLDIDWTFPPPTHSVDTLLYTQEITGEYWERHKIPKSRQPTTSPRFARRVRNLSNTLIPPEHKPWRTVRDALADVPDPRHPQAQEFLNHVFQDGAKQYKGHTGSPLDLPAKTLKAGDHGVPGGENTMLLDDGTVRYFTVREAARLQTFPDGFVFHGAWSETMRQLGNAVPVILAQRVAASVAQALVECQTRQQLRERGRNIA